MLYELSARRRDGVISVYLFRSDMLVETPWLHAYLEL